MYKEKRAKEGLRPGELFSLDIFGNFNPNKPIVAIPFIDNRNGADENNKKVAQLEAKKAPVNAHKIIALKAKINDLSKELRKESCYLNHAKRERVPRILFTEITQDVTPLLCVYPYLTPKAMAMTMNNAREFIAQHNQRIVLYNSQINLYNVSVQVYKKENELTEVQKEYSRLFKLKNKGLKASNYNQKAEEFNNNYGLLIQKRPEQKIKYATELVLQQMLYSYSLQLQFHSDNYLKLGLSNIHPIKECEINAYEIVNFKRNGVHSIDVTTRTIRNHRERLEEAGILFSYTFHGQNKGVTSHINPQILVVFDAKTQRFSTSENQSVTSESVKNFPHINEVQDPFKNNINKNENGEADFLDKGTPTADFSFDFYKNIPLQTKNSQQTGGGGNVKISENFKENIQHPQELAIDLSNGKYFNYSVPDIRYFFKEATKGTLTKDEMNELVCQEMMKYASKLYRNSNVWVGCWKNAINNYLQNKFWVNNGNGRFLVRKEVMVESLQEFIWCINNAMKFFTKSGITPLYPSKYFDFERKTKKEIGFEPQRKKYQTHLKKIAEIPEKNKKAKRASEKRQFSNSNSLKFNNILNQFFNNRKELPEVMEYVKNNLPSHFSDKLIETIKSISNLKYQC